MQIEVRDLRPWVVPAGVGIISFAAGAVAGYFLHKRKWDYRYIPSEAEGIILPEDGSVQLEVPFGEQQVRVQTENIPVIILPNPEPEEPEEEEYETVVMEDDGEVLHITIFDGPEPDGWDYETEVPLRDEDGVYVIHKDEFMSNLEDNDQSVLTYYEGDGILCDEEDVPIYGHEQMIGPLLFGKGSGDPNVVYIRNAGIKSEWEIIRDRGFYQVEVMGAQIESQMAKDDLKHSKTPRKFRSD